MINKKIENILIVIILVIYTVGLLGFLLNINGELFKNLTPLNLIITTSILFLINGKFSLKILFVSTIVFTLGLIIEIIGVKTGLLFGTYEYGQTLGIKFYGVPLTIGLNWLFLSFSSYAISKKIVNNIFIQSLIASGLMVFLDFFVEPIAIKLDFWSWENGQIPIQNYFMWFFASLIMQLIIHAFKIDFKTKAGLSIYAIQLLFFILLNLFY